MVRWVTLLIAVANLLLNPAMVPKSRAALVAATNVTYGLAAWWPLDETSGTTFGDLSGYGNTANLVGAPASIAGVVSNAYQFDGSSQYATVTYSYSYDVTNFTLMCWINTTANGGVILSRDPYAAWELAINTGVATSSGSPGQPSFFNGSSWTTAGVSINSGTWQHVAVVVGSGTTSFYVNGQLTATAPQKAPATSSSVGLYMAQRIGGGLLLNCALDDVRIYNRPLSAAEIANQYQWRSGAGTLFPITPPPVVPSLAKSYYIDYSTGSDANDGLSISTPWQRQPYMPGFTGTYKHQPGDNFIFRGGVTWPSGCFPITVGYGGIITAPDYYGVSNSYFAGSQWTKPIWDDSGNPLNTMSSTGNALIYVQQSYVTLDSFVFTNLNWNANVSVYGINTGSATSVVITNCEFRNFIPTSPGGDNLICVNGPTSGAGLCNKVSHCVFTGKPTSTGTGYAAYYIETFEYNTVSFMPNGMVGLCLTNQYNFIHDMQPSMTPGVHENCLYQMLEQNKLNYCHHNIVSNNSCGMTLYLSLLGIAPGQTATIYCYDNLLASNTAAVPSICLDPESNGNGTRGTAYIWNNTLQDSESPSLGYIRVAHRAGADWSNVVAENNHFITEGTAGLLNDAGSLATVTSDYSFTNNNATAIASGYTAANGWQPVSSSCPTVGRGTSTPGALFLTDIQNKSRFGVSWDVGAYQYRSGSSGPTAWTAGLHVVSTP